MQNDELKHIAPHLEHLKSLKTGFVVPKNYFEGIEDCVESELKLRQFSNNSGFKIPENYFENVENEVFLKTKKTDEKTLKIPKGYLDSLEDKVFDKIKSTEKSKVFTLNRLWIPASVAAMLLLTFTFYNQYQKPIEKVEVAEMENWIETGMVDVNSYEIASVYESELDKIDLGDFLKEDVVEDYLSNDMDELMYNELQ